MGISDKEWMQQALQQAMLAAELGEVPIGAVLTINNQLVGTGYNRVIMDNDPTAHAEIIALRAAAQHVNNYRLNDATLYVTLEPCPMCAAAMVHARIKRLVFAARDFQIGAAGSQFNLLQGYPLNHQVSIDEGILASECAHQLKAFFKERR